MWRFNICVWSIVVGGLSSGACTGCGSDKALPDAGAAIHIWPESAASSDQVGVYVEVDGVASGRLDLEAFDGTLCAVGSDAVDAGMPDASAPRDAGVTADAGAGSGTSTGCPSKLSLTVSKSPQTYVTVFEWASGATSALITATLYSDGKEQLSDFRRISKSSPPDAGIDAAPPDAAPADATPATDATTKDAP